ncbi:MAG TPA: integrase core domain-containing protein, partial [Terriglobales bacterium]|nr:integrase core domain-containing protein [Terriglobales bacterium]
TQRLQASGLLPSMGSVRVCYDNAMMESFWSRVQVELLDRKRWRTRVELASALFEYLEIFHNRQRRHSALGMLTPVEFEIRYPFGLTRSPTASDGIRADERRLSERVPERRRERAYPVAR